MIVKFYVSEFKYHERHIADSFSMGIRGAGDRFRTSVTSNFDGCDPSVDLVCVFALKGASRKILESYREIGTRTLLIDKGLMRASTGLGAPKVAYYRLGLDEFMPLSRIRRMMTEKRNPSRWLALGMKVKLPVRSEPEFPIIYCGGSQKYCDFHDLGNEHDYAVKVIDEIRQHAGSHPIVYRPKPSFSDAIEIPDTRFSRTPQEYLGPMLATAHALVTHGSHAGIDSIVGGVPVITLGPCAAWPLANHAIGRLSGELFFPSKGQIFDWLSTITYWQWNIREMASGEMWRWLREEMEKPA